MLVPDAAFAPVVDQEGDLAVATCASTACFLMKLLRKNGARAIPTKKTVGGSSNKINGA